MSRINFVSFSFSKEVLIFDINGKEYTFGNEGGAQYPKFWEENPEFMGVFEVDFAKLPIRLTRGEKRYIQKFMNTLCEIIYKGDDI